MPHAPDSPIVSVKSFESRSSAGSKKSKRSLKRLWRVKKTPPTTPQIDRGQKEQPKLSGRPIIDIITAMEESQTPPRKATISPKVKRKTLPVPITASTPPLPPQPKANFSWLKAASSAKKHETAKRDERLRAAFATSSSSSASSSSSSDADDLSFGSELAESLSSGMYEASSAIVESMMNALERNKNIGKLVNAIDHPEDGDDDDDDDLSRLLDEISVSSVSAGSVSSHYDSANDAESEKEEESEDDAFFPTFWRNAETPKEEAPATKDPEPKQEETVVVLVATPPSSPSRDVLPKKERMLPRVGLKPRRSKDKTKKKKKSPSKQPKTKQDSAKVLTIIPPTQEPLEFDERQLKAQEAMKAAAAQKIQVEETPSQVVSPSPPPSPRRMEAETKPEDVKPLPDKEAPSTPQKKEKPKKEKMSPRLRRSPFARKKSTKSPRRSVRSVEEVMERANLPDSDMSDNELSYAEGKKSRSDIVGALLDFLDLDGGEGPLSDAEKETPQRAAVEPTRSPPPTASCPNSPLGYLWSHLIGPCDPEKEVNCVSELPTELSCDQVVESKGNVVDTIDEDDNARPTSSQAATEPLVDLSFAQELWESVVSSEAAIEVTPECGPQVDEEGQAVSTADATISESFLQQTNVVVDQLKRNLPGFLDTPTAPDLQTENIEEQVEKHESIDTKAAEECTPQTREATSKPRGNQNPFKPAKWFPLKGKKNPLSLRSSKRKSKSQDNDDDGADFRRFHTEIVVESVITSEDSANEISLPSKPESDPGFFVPTPPSSASERTPTPVAPAKDDSWDAFDSSGLEAAAFSTSFATDENPFSEKQSFFPAKQSGSAAGASQGWEDFTKSSSYAGSASASNSPSKTSVLERRLRLRSSSMKAVNPSADNNISSPTSVTKVVVQTTGGDEVYGAGNFDFDRF